MLEFSDAPYRFFEARTSPTLVGLGREINRRMILPGPKHPIPEILISGETGILRRPMFVMNHPTHSNPQTLSEVHRRLGIDSCFMVAYDVFLGSARNLLLG